ncbi:TPA: capsular polysaccharide biosynthesis protein Cps4B [Streptococcus pneumoniae]|uniref:Tyrosine-protein phosphatase n=1 Tax=Streptococcus pneumoniae TaxID=1313 RepID=Q4JZY3_STREE|nr:capsular polysaccharide biosynthesis protein Cps4B [Streptococcus pneumoniae]AEY99876.1 pneumococcal capsular regulatory tyrosine phosphatase [Streptococcus pneumoniae]MBW5013283.1 tyrosine protein phosphatase [Streptococcus pneumoniae]MBW7517944.1 tyrosine protein phosphatase [Streptococcus pneumoniae]MDG7205628.1 tyrosine protein phosphatase [Streptococcus pneumoniae]MDG8490837.1 tyrosine protein phosphatase [Streptococcus pneumoniae]
MIDIHSHIVFDVDDGPKSREESKALLAESYRQGVRTIVSTSHRRKGMFETPEEKIAENFLQVREIAKEVADDLVIAYGAEIYYTLDALEKLEKKEIPTLNDSRYALIEFSMHTSYRQIHTGLSNILMLGITPVIAHIERYDALENNEKRVRELIDMGCYTQINSYHVLKPKLFGERYKFMKKRARYFLERDLVHVVASDMHNLNKRPPYMKEAYELISKQYGERRARELFIENPRLILSDQII